MKKIGITGGIGSGKSTVCRIFETLGIPVFYADNEAKWLMNNHPELMDKISQAFGDDCYINGDLNRAYLANIVFNNTESLEKLNSIVHPFVHDTYEKWAKKQESKFVLHEAAILFESGFDKYNDKNFLVYANEETRIKRVMKRDFVDYEQVKARIQNQMSDEDKIKLADGVIYNDESQLVIPQVVKLYQELSAE